MKKVLIALDYDPTAQKIAEDGFALAKAMSAQVVLLHVVADPVYYSSAMYSPIMGFGGYMDTEIMQPDIIDHLKKTSNDFLEKSKKHLGDDTIEIMVIEGDVADAIVAAAKKITANVIVMGSHSRKWLEQIVMGSVTENVLSQTSIPLFIIPTKEQR
jgi:nucleotide-binding universal stress UspA family protein